jgi:hypothetical protein
MQRRSFLATVATSATSSMILGPAELRAAEEAGKEYVEMPSPDMDAYVARVDAGVARIRSSSITAGKSGFVGDATEIDALSRDTFEALFLTGMLGDLPLPAQTHEGMQKRLEAAMPVFDRAANGMQTFIASRTDEQLAFVQQALRTEGTSEQIIATIDAEAERTGVSPQRRLQTRKMLEHLTWRLANQPPRLLVGEYLEKVEKVADTDLEAEARQRQVASKLGEEAFWTAQQQQVLSKRDRRIRRGAKVMGIGVLVFAGGGLIVAAGAFAGVFLMTVGVVMVLIGLIMLLVGLGTKRDA